MFCVVKCETKTTIKTVPMLWITEENGEVWILWPWKLENRPVEFENAVKNIITPKSDWQKLKCQVLITNINTYKEGKASEKKISNLKCASKPKENPKKPKKSEQHQPWQQVLKEVQDLHSSLKKLVVEHKSINVAEHAENPISIVERSGHNNCGEQIYDEISEPAGAIAMNICEGSAEFGKRDEYLGRKRADNGGEQVEHYEIGELAGAIAMNICEGSAEFGKRDEFLGRKRADNGGEQVENYEIGEQAGALGTIEFEKSDDYKLPINEKRHIVAFDDALEDKEVASKQDKSFQRLYAADYKTMVRMVTQRIFTDNFLKDYNFHGQRGKLPLNEYGNVVNLIIDATHKKFPSIEEKTVLKYFMEHIKHAAERHNKKTQP